MSYCSTADLVNISGSTASSTVLQAIIDDGDREIDAYLAPHGLAGTDTGAPKSASLKLAQAGLLVYNRMSGSSPPVYSSGDYSQSDTVDLLGIAKHLRDSAFALLDKYIEDKTTITYLLKVNT